MSTPATPKKRTYTRPVLTDVGRQADFPSAAKAIKSATSLRPVVVRPPNGMAVATGQKVPVVMEAG